MINLHCYIRFLCRCESLQPILVSRAVQEILQNFNLFYEDCIGGARPVALRFMQLQLTPLSALTPIQGTHRFTGQRLNRNYTVFPLMAFILFQCGN